MPSYSRKVEVPGKSSQELYDRISKDIERFLEKTPIGKFEITRDPSRKQVGVKSSMVTATLHCHDGLMHFDAKLSLLAAPFKSKLDAGIDHWIQKTFKA
ncbi:MAG: hypothetical protein ACXWPM_00965 [Bdellovibrionota bacterium]